MTEIIRVDEEKASIDALKPAIEAVRRGGVVVFPTETVYGVGADAFNRRAVRKIFEVKGRPADNPLIVHVCSMEQVENVAREISDDAKKLMDAFWPGPLTVVLPKREEVPAEVTAGLDTVAVRMPSHRVALKLIEGCETPIAAPSANIAGKPSGTKAEHVMQDFYGKVDVIIDSGDTPLGLESTVVKIEKDRVVVLRPGFITPEDIESVIGKKAVLYEQLKGKDLSKPLSPGMKYRHYAPDADMVVVVGENRDLVIRKISEVAISELKKGRKVGTLLFDDETHAALKKLENLVVIKLCGRDARKAARTLFSVLREFDKENVDFIVAEGRIEDGLWISIMNRLKKAAEGRIIQV